jgi:hypothetical protein
MTRLQKWLDHKFGVNVYELRDGNIVKDRGRKPSDTLALSDIASWHVEHEMVFDIIRIRLQGGDEVRWLDTYNDLLGILRSELKDKEDQSN